MNIFNIVFTTCLCLTVRYISKCHVVWFGRGMGYKKQKTRFFRLIHGAEMRFKEALLIDRLIKEKVGEGFNDLFYKNTNKKALSLLLMVSTFMLL